MLAPISWLKDFVDITIPTRQLAWKLTELGLGVESIKKIGNDEVLELEITPNRPDLLSIVGIAREIAAAQQKSLKLKPVEIPGSKKNLPIKVNNNYSLFERYSGVIIDNVKIKPSPKWLTDRLILIDLRPINNLVDITNYVMFELGIPLHAFDYDQIKGHEINVTQARGGEEFITVDNLSYKLPAGAIVIKDNQRIIDLCGIKGGLNSGITNSTSTVYLQVTADDPYLIRKASQALSLRSDASAIFERGVDKGGILESLKRAAKLILDLAGGEIGSPVIDYSQRQFTPWKLKLSNLRLKKILGYEIPVKKVISILESLSLNPKYEDEVITVKVPTYRNDLQLEEDLIEEIARVYGYNNFPTSLIESPIPREKVAYYKNFSVEKNVKQLLVACGFNEIYSYSLIGSEQMDSLGIPLNQAVKISNPVSREYEYLRPVLLGNMLSAIKFNQANFQDFGLFELGRIYKGFPPETLEKLSLTIAIAENNFYQLKGIVEEILDRLNIKNVEFRPLLEKSFKSRHSGLSRIVYPELNRRDSGVSFDRLSFPRMTNNKISEIFSGNIKLGLIGELNSQLTSNFGLKIQPIICQIDFDILEKLAGANIYHPVPVTPELVEDLTLIIPDNIYLAVIIEEIKNTSKLITKVDFISSYGNTRTLKITYQSPKSTLSSKNIKIIRQKILSDLDKKFKVSLKS